MTTIYLIRHAEAEGNLYRIAQGQDNSNLTDRGWRQVRALEERFRDVEIDAVYSSDLYRTCATASAIYKPKGLPLHRDPELREICVGVWEQQTWGDIYRRWPEQMKYFSVQPHLWDVEGAEKPLDVQARGLRAIRKIAAENDGKTIAIFSHGYIIRLMLAHLQGQSLEQVGETPTGDNTAVSLLEADGDSLRVIFRDDNSHLKTEAFLANEKIVKRANGLEPGLRYQPLDPETQAEFFADLVQENWNREAAFNREKLLSDAKDRQTLVGYRRDEPIGVIQLGNEPGWISLICIREDMRKRGFGAQLIGQAVYRTRQMGGEMLKVALLAETPAVTFFEDSGFVLLSNEDGVAIYGKDIRFDPEFL
jgi:probable phosphoglycerate mutase